MTAVAMALPAETWLQIAHLSELSDMAALMRSNRRLHNLIHEELYRIIIKKDMRAVTIDAAEVGNLDTLKAAASYGADLSMAFPYPLHPDVLQIWDDRNRIQRGPGMDEEDMYCDWGWASPLHIAVMRGREDVVKWLIEQHVDLEGPGRCLCNCRALIPRSMNGIWSVSSPELWQFPAWTPLHYAICHEQTSIARLLLAAGACSTDLVVSPTSAKFPRWDGYDLTETGRARVALLDPSRRANPPQLWPDPVYPVSISALHIAAYSGNQALLHHLIVDYGLDIDIEDANDSTPLHYAISGLDTSTVNYFLSLGASPDQTNELGNNALWFALLFNKNPLALHLLESGALPWEHESQESWMRWIFASMSQDTGNKPIYSGASETFQKAVEAIIRRTRETVPPGRDIQRELAAIFLRACMTPRFEGRDLQHLLRISELSFDTEFVRGFEADDLTNPVCDCFYQEDISVYCDDFGPPYEGRYTLQQLALHVVGLKFPAEMGQQLLRRFEYLLNLPTTRPKLTLETSDLSPLFHLFNRVKRLALRLSDYETSNIDPLGLCPAIKVLGQAGEWFPLDEVSNASEHSSFEDEIFVVWEFCDAAYEFKAQDSAGGQRWANLVIQEMPKDVRKRWESKEIRVVRERFNLL